MSTTTAIYNSKPPLYPRRNSGKDWLVILRTKSALGEVVDHVRFRTKEEAEAYAAKEAC